MLVISLQILFIFSAIVELKVVGKLARNMLTVFVLSVYCAFTGLRWETGTDWLAYISAYQLSANLEVESLGNSFEPLYMLFIAYMANAFDSFSILLFVQSLFITYFIYRAAGAAKVGVALLCATLFAMQSQFYYPVRQQIAISIAMFAVGAFIFEARRSFLYSFRIIFASCIHASSLITLLLFPISGSVVKLRHLILIAIITSLGLYFISELSFFEERVTSYLIVNDYEFSDQRNYARLLERLCSVSILLYMCKQLKSTCGTVSFNNLAARFIVIGLVVSTIALLYFPYLSRLSPYFTSVEALLFSRIVTYRKSFPPSNIFLIISLACIYMLKFFMSLLPYWDLIDPYYFVWDDFYRDLY